jgi:mycothiol synthase
VRVSAPQPPDPLPPDPLPPDPLPPDPLPPDPQISVLERLSPDDVADLRRLVTAAAQRDGVEPLNEHAILHLRQGGAPHARHVVARRGGALTGYGQLDSSGRSRGATAELVVAPDQRRRGLGTALAETMIELVEPLPLALWAHGNHIGAQRLADSLGFDRVRDLWQLRLRWADAPAEQLDAAPALPPGVSVRPFQPGADEEAWLSANARAFAEHPEQGALELPDLEARMAEPWFDPAGFFLAERAGAVVGFHWTKVHGGTPAHGHEPVGEVYVVGVDPDERGHGLGRTLTLIGLQHLRRRGVGEVMLYVDADNLPAIKTYQRLGFVPVLTDVLYCRG